MCTAGIIESLLHLSKIPQLIVITTTDAAMPISFADLPLELRQQIYDLIFISPTHHLCARFAPRTRRLRQTSSETNRKTRPKNKAPLSKLVELIPCEILSSNPLPDASPVAVSFMSTNRQIYNETRDMIWSRNTLSFSSCETAVKILKTLGQKESRRIVRVQLLCLAEEMMKGKDFAKIMSVLASRTRLGALRDVSVCFCAIEYGFNRAGSWARRDELIGRLKNGGKAGWEKGVRRVAVVDGIIDQNEKDLSECLSEARFHIDDILEWHVSELACAWGGGLVYDKRLLWDECKQLERLGYTLKFCQQN